METTSAPRWDVETGGPVDGGRYVTVLSFGGAAEPRARALVAGRSGRRVGWLRMSPGWTAGAEAVLSRGLAAARVGWRLARRGRGDGAAGAGVRRGGGSAGAPAS
ncbi:hypothetical protein IM877_13455 [Rhodococcus sp. GG48]|nr:hypothetical protein [Rhodococcus sp. GG48]